MTKKHTLLFLLTTLSLGMFAGVAWAQVRPKVNTTPPKITKPKVKKVKIDNSAVKAAIDKTGSCHKRLDTSTETTYRAICLTGERSGKRVECTLTREILSSPGRYRQVNCNVFNVSGTHRYRLSRTGNKQARPLPVADVACGCHPTLLAKMTESGGEFYYSGND